MQALPLTKQTWAVYGGPSYGTEVDNSTSTNCYSNIELYDSLASQTVITAQVFRAEVTGYGFSGSGYLTTCLGHVVMNSAGQNSGPLYSFRARGECLAGTISSFTGYYVAAPNNAGTITTYTGVSVAAPSGTVTNAFGVTVADLAGSTASRALNAQISSGTGKYNLYCSGTARNYLRGKTSFGADVDGEMYVTTEDGIAIKDGITAPAALAGYAKLFIDQADGDLKIIFPDAVTKTIVVDS